MFDDDDEGIFDGPTGAGTKKTDDVGEAHRKEAWFTRQLRQEDNPKWFYTDGEGRDHALPVHGSESLNQWARERARTDPLRPYDNLGEVHDYEETEMKTSRPISRVEFLEALHRGLMTREIISPVPNQVDYYRVTKEDFAKYLLKFDPSISTISVKNRWQYFQNEYIEPVSWGYQFYLAKNNEDALRSLIDNIERKLPVYAQADADDPEFAPAHKAEATATPELPMSPELLEAFLDISRDLGSLRELYKEKLEADDKRREDAKYGYEPNPLHDSIRSISSELQTLTSLYQEARQQQESQRRDAHPLDGSLAIIGTNIAQLTESINQQQEGLSRLIELQEQRLLPETEEPIEEKELTMAERVKNAALETGSGVAAAFQEGLKISGSQQLSKKVVNVFHNKLGNHLPGAETAVGQKIEAFAIPALVHFMASAFSDKIPKADLVQRTCLRAITGESKDSGDELLGLLLPVFSEIASIENMTEMASQFAEEDAAEALPKEDKERSVNELLLADQLGIPEGAKVEVNIITEKAEETGE